VSKEKQDVEIAIYEGLDNTTRKLPKVFIKLEWKKLHKYYSRLTSAAYVGAVVFNLAKKYGLALLLVRLKAGGWITRRNWWAFGRGS
jgi:hypothetical protein